MARAMSLRIVFAVAFAQLIFAACGPLPPPPPPPPCETLGGVSYCIDVIETFTHPKCPSCSSSSGRGWQFRNKSTARDITLTYATYNLAANGTLTPVLTGVTAIVPANQTINISPGGCYYSYYKCPGGPFTEQVVKIVTSCFVGDICPHNFELSTSGPVVPDVEAGGCASTCSNGGAGCIPLTTLSQRVRDELELIGKQTTVDAAPLSVGLERLFAALGVGEECKPRTIAFPGVPGSFESVGQTCILSIGVPPGTVFPDGTGSTYDALYFYIPSSLQGTIARSSQAGNRVKGRLDLSWEGLAPYSVGVQALLSKPDGTKVLTSDIVTGVSFEGPKGSGVPSFVTIEGSRFLCMGGATN